MSTNPRSRRWTRGPRAFVTAVLAGVMLAGAPAALAGDDQPQKNGPPKADKPEIIEQQLDLPQAKANALFALLAPDNVKVRVAARDGGVRVEGTPQEIKALAAFADLLMRNHGQSEEKVRALIEEQRKSWGESKTFKLPDKTADAMLMLLAFDDVPLYVSRVVDGITVDAGQDDLRIISQVVQIARGNRLDGGKKRADAPPPAAKGEKKRQTAEKGRKQGKEAKRPPIAEKAIETYEQVLAAKEAVEAELQQLRQELHRQLEDAHRQAEQVQQELHQQLAEVHRQAEQMHIEAQHLHEQLEHEIQSLREDFDRLAHNAPPTPPDVPLPETMRFSVQVRQESFILPDHHADHLFELLAPDDIEDVLVSREGNKITVRGNPKDVETIEQLVRLLTRNAEKEHASGIFGGKPEQR